jgi:lysophospholipase L1-like esterase
MKNLSLTALAFLSLVLPVPNATAQDVAAPTGPQSGQKIAFLGDSITQMCNWVSLVGAAFQHVGRPLTVINAGVSGDTSTMMLARLKTDVLDKKPDWMVLNCGVNDVWGSGPGGHVDLDHFKKNVTSIVDQATAAGIKVVMTTFTQIGEGTSDVGNPREPYNDFVRGFAKERNLPLADLAKREVDTVTEYHNRWPHSRLSYLTHDGTHMNGEGDIMMATGVLKALGFTDAQIAQEKTDWLKGGGVGYPLGEVVLSTGQSEQVHDLAEKQGLSVEAYLTQEIQRGMPLILSQPPAPTPAPPK